MKSGGSSGAQRFVYDGNALIADHNAAGTMLRRYVHGTNVDADDPLIWYAGAGTAATDTRYVYADPRGSIILVGPALEAMKPRSRYTVPIEKRVLTLSNAETAAALDALFQDAAQCSRRNAS